MDVISQFKSNSQVCFFTCLALCLIAMQLAVTTHYRGLPALHWLARALELLREHHLASLENSTPAPDMPRHYLHPHQTDVARRRRPRTRSGRRLRRAALSRCKISQASCLTCRPMPLNPVLMFADNHLTTCIHHTRRRTALHGRRMQADRSTYFQRMDPICPAPK